MKTALATLSLLATLAFTLPASAQCSDNLSAPRGKLAATSVHDLILFAAGDDGPGTSAGNVVDIYNATSGTWTSASLNLWRYNLAAASAGGLAFFAGGGRFSNAIGNYALYSDVNVYDPATNSWSTMHLSQRRQWLAGTSVGSQVLFAGGSPIAGPPFGTSNRVDIYDTATQVWSQAALSVPRTRLTAASSGNIAVFAGGRASSGPSAVVDIYDGTTGTWSTASLSVARIDPTATAVGTTILIAGGAEFIGATTITSDVVDVYDTATGVWTVEHLSSPRTQLTATSARGRALFAGGVDSNGEVSDVVDVRDAAGWFTMQLSEPRQELAAASSAGMSMIAGGRDSTNSWSTVVDSFPVGFARSYCFGDGTGNACPCGNLGAAGEGCANSTGAGANLTGSGCNTVSNDSLVMNASGIPGGKSALLFGAVNRIAGGSGALFGDGLRCTGGALQRLGWTTANASGEASWGPGLIASAGYVAGDRRQFQAWYRDPSGPCGSLHNLSNGVEMTFAP